MVAALAAAGCTPGESATSSSAGQAKHFDVAGFGKLKPGMSKQDALATGELGATGAGKSGTCEDYRFQSGPAPDPAELAEDADVEKKYADAQKAADEAQAKIGPVPGPNASAAEFADSAERNAAAAEASAKVAELASASTDRIVKRAEAREAHGGVVFGQDKLRLIVAPPGATTAKNIGKDSTLEQLKAAYPDLVSKGEDAYELPVPDQKGWVLTFDLKAGKVVALMLFNPEIKCS